jgi:hypothetical protein
MKDMTDFMLFQILSITLLWKQCLTLNINHLCPELTIFSVLRFVP